MGPNLTGTPNSSDYIIGRGIVLIGKINPVTGRVISWRDAGNAPTFALGASVDTLPHQSSRDGLKRTDLEVILQDTRTVSFTLEEFNHENLAEFFSGDKAAYTNAAATNIAEYLMVPDGQLEVGRWYDIRSALGVRAYDIDSADLVVKTNETPTTTLLADGIDYELDAMFGRFRMLNSSDVQDAVTLGVGLLVTLTGDAGAKTVTEVRGLTRTATDVALKILGVNAVTGERFELEFHKTRVKATGDLALIGDDWAAMTFEATIESNTAGYPESPYFNLRSLGEAPPTYLLSRLVSTNLFVFFNRTVEIGTPMTASGIVIHSASLGAQYHSRDSLRPDAIGEDPEGFYMLFADISSSPDWVEDIPTTLAAGTISIDFTAHDIKDPTTGQRPTPNVVGAAVEE